jgi:hypothetical protein
MIIASRYLHDTEYPLAEVSTATIPLNAGGFGQLPGNIQVQGKVYDCTQPGLIRFFDTDTGIAEQRAMWTGDVYGFISACSWAHTHGSADESRGMAGIASWMRNHKARLRCGVIVDYMMWIMPQVGVQVRRCGVLTGDTPNSYDNGHICFEAMLSGKWRMFDMSNGSYYTLNGEHLGLKDIILNGVNNCQRVRIDVDKDHSADPSGNICYGIYWEVLRKTPQGFIDWNTRMFQIPYVANAAYVPAQYASRALWVQGLGISVLPQAQWNAMFYG